MIFFNRNMGLTFTILAGMFQIAAIVCGVLAYSADKASEKIPQTTNKVFNINEDYINRDKKTNITKDSSTKKKQSIKDNSIILKSEKLKKIEKTDESKNNNSSVNNGVINSGVNNGGINSGANYGTQTINYNYNYNKNSPRELNNQDIETIKLNIPKNYKLDFEYFHDTDESVNYAKQLADVLIKMGYDINSAKGFGGLVLGGKPRQENERFIYYLNDEAKSVKIVVREQK